MNYTKFVIMGQERTGSNLLQMLLYSHGDVMSFGEIFNPSEEIRKKSIQIARPLELNEDPIEYLTTYLFTRYPVNIKAVGFRLFYSHARDGQWQKVRDYLRGSEVRVIHLMRKNLLDRYISYQMAMESAEWIILNQNNVNESQRLITIDSSALIKDILETKYYQEETEELFKDNPKAILFYEDLCQYPKGESERIQRFLGIDPKKLTPTTKKQQLKKKSSMINNYEKLKEEFIDGLSNGLIEKEWLQFFNEEQELKEII